MNINKIEKTLDVNKHLTKFEINVILFGTNKPSLLQDASFKTLFVAVRSKARQALKEYR